MTKPSSQLYRVKLTEVKQRLNRTIQKGCSNSNSDPVVFFRADDIGIPSHNFSKLIESFNRHQLPLCLATVPAWLTPGRLSELHSLTGTSGHQWYWHQHGYVHRNFENRGKNQEFGPARNGSKIMESLQRGKQRLDSLLGQLNQPVFTPPWNRCNEATLESLKALGFRAISRSKGARPETQPGFPDFQVNVDLHTRKEPLAEQGFLNLVDELEQSLASGRCGIMLHHQRMNRQAIEFLDILLQCLKEQRSVSFVHFGDLIHYNC